MIAAASLLAALALAAAALPAAAAETVVTLKTPTGELAGALQGAGPGRPAVLIVAGSGPTDRDGNSPLGVRSQNLKLLADGLEARGITTLRTDKRGVGGSRAALANGENGLLLTTYADDVRAWTAELKRLSGAPCVWIAGHSEGALLAEMAAQNNHDVCGLVLISGAGRRAGDVLREQLAATPEPLKGQFLKAMADLEAGRTTDCPPELVSLCRPSIQPYMISWLAQDPAVLIKTVPGRVLIVQGDNDLQIGLADAHRLAEARPDAKLAVIKGANHVLKIAPTDRPGNMATYADPNLPLAPGVVETIADFVTVRR